MRRQFQCNLLHCLQCLKWSKKNLLLILTVAAVVLGTLLGFCLRFAEPSKTAIMLINFPGKLLIRMLKMLIIPLVVSSLISGMCVDKSLLDYICIKIISHHWKT